MILTPRLACIAALVPQGAQLADVGTDHGKLPITLLIEGRIAHAIGSDLREGPLDHAARNAEEHGVILPLRLAAGLDGISPEECDTVTIAGMGGQTIAEILQNAPWTADGDHLLLLQPMTKVEYLRKWLVDNGYRFTEERLVFDKSYLYPVFAVRGGTQPPLTPAQQYGGILLDGDPLYADYLDERIGKLQRAVDGLRRSATPENSERADYLSEVCQALREKRETL